MVALLVLGVIFIRPFGRQILSFFLSLLKYGMLGFLLIGGFNLLGAYFGVKIPFNLLTTFVAGFLGFPGLGLLFLLLFFC